MRKDRKTTMITLADFKKNYLPKNFFKNTEGKQIESDTRASDRGKEIVHEIIIKCGLS